MSKPIENFGEIMERTIYLEPFENIENIIDKTNKTKRIKIKETIRNGLGKLKIMKIN